MLIEELSKYGNIKHQYSGTGCFRNSSSDCDFGIVQLSDGSIYLNCEFKSISDSDKLDLKKGDTPTFNGLTEDGKQLVVEGELMLLQNDVSYPRSRSTFVSNGEFILEVGNKDFSGEGELRFNITNFIFVGTQFIQLSEAESRRMAVEFELGEYTVSIQKIPNYDVIKEILRAKRNIEITSQILIKYKSNSEIKDIVQVVDNLCGLLTIANGTLVSWISYEIWLPTGEQSYVSHQPNITDSFGLTPLIDKMPPEAIEVFVNNVYKNYLELNSIYDLDSIGRLYSSIRLSGFIEVRSLSIASLVEFILNRFADNQPEQQTLIDPKIFKKQRDSLKEQLREAFKSLFPELTEDIHNEIQKKISDLNRISFSMRLKRFIKYYCIPITDEEITNFIQTRNKLAHGLSFNGDDGVQQYQKMVHFFDRLLLGMLRYKGYYVNFEDSNLWSGEQKYRFEPIC